MPRIIDDDWKIAVNHDKTILYLVGQKSKLITGRDYWLNYCKVSLGWETDPIHCEACIFSYDFDPFLTPGSPICVTGILLQSAFNDERTHMIMLIKE